MHAHVGDDSNNQSRSRSKFDLKKEAGHAYHDNTERTKVARPPVAGTALRVAARLPMIAPSWPLMARQATASSLASSKNPPNEKATQPSTPAPLKRSLLQPMQTRALAKRARLEKGKDA